MWQSLLGHADRIEMFRRAIGRNRLSHAFVFAGPDGIGKRAFALKLSQCLVCDRFADEALNACGKCPQCVQATAGTHPDILHAGLPQGKSEIPIEVFAGTRDRRGREGMCYELSLKPMAASRRVAIIDHVDHLNAESANTLLKTLEEPPPNSLIIMIATNASSLLPTIRSRCQIVRFSPLSDESIVSLLLQRQLVDSVEDARAVALLSGGSMTTVEQLLDPELRSLRARLLEQLALGEKMQPLDVARELTAAVEEAGGNSGDQRRFAMWLVQFASEYYRESFRAAMDAHHRAPLPQDRHSSRSRTRVAERTRRLLERTLDALDQLRDRSPIPLCLDGLFDDLSRILRSS